MKKTILLLAISAFSTASFAQATRNVLMEEYTGTWCPNCPDGHTYIKALEASYPNTFINIGMHNNDAYTIPYETAMEANVQVAGFPRATIDRFTYSLGNAFCMSRGFWTGAVADRVNLTSPVDITSLATGYISGTRQLTVNVNYKFLSAVSEETHLTCVLLEDSILAAQSGATGTYTHMDVCRALLSADTWGDANHPTSVAAGASYSKTYTYTVPAAVNDKNMRVVAFINKKVGTAPTLSTGTEILNAKVATVSGPLAASTLTKNNFSVGNVFPNPTQDLCAIEFSLPASASVSAYITDLRGATIAKLCNGSRSEGNHTIMWSGNGANSTKMPAGIYMMNLVIDGNLFTRKIVLQ
jgi:hypothetical protein